MVDLRFKLPQSGCGAVGALGHQTRISFNLDDNQDRPEIECYHYKKPSNKEPGLGGLLNLLNILKIQK